MFTSELASHIEINKKGSEPESIVRVGSDWDSQILTGNEFQTLGAKNSKAQEHYIRDE